MSAPTNPACRPEHCADPRDRCHQCPERSAPGIGVAEIIAQQQMQHALELDRILAAARTRGITTVRVQNGVLGTIEYDLTSAPAMRATTPSRKRCVKCEATDKAVCIHQALPTGAAGERCSGCVDECDPTKGCLMDIALTPPAREPVAWAVVKDGGPVTNGRIWADRASAKRFVRNERSYAMQQPRLGYDIVPLYTHPPTPSGRVTVTEAMVDAGVAAALHGLPRDPNASDADNLEGGRALVRSILTAALAGRRGA